MIANHRIGQMRQHEANPHALAVPSCRRGQLSFSSLVMLLWALMMMALLSGCWTQLIHPIYSDETLVFDERLLGSFDTDDGVLTFSRDGMDSCEATFVDEDGVAVVHEVHLASINDALFMDMYLEEPPDSLPEFAAMQILPLHWIFRVDQIGDSLKLSELDNNWMKKHLAAFPGVIAHTIVDDRVILTDTTERLQAFIGAHARNADAWEESEAIPRLPMNVR